MEQSILTSTKKLLNVAPDDESFDLDLITHINSAFSHLHQLGIGPAAGFQIEDETPKWSDFLGEGTPINITNLVKTNIQSRVRLIFDPPQMQHLLSALERQLQESDWRLSVLREETDWVDPDPPDVLVVDGGDPAGA